MFCFSWICCKPYKKLDPPNYETVAEEEYSEEEYSEEDLCLEVALEEIKDLDLKNDRLYYRIMQLKKEKEALRSKIIAEVNRIPIKRVHSARQMMPGMSIEETDLFLEEQALTDKFGQEFMDAHSRAVRWYLRVHKSCSMTFKPRRVGQRKTAYEALVSLHEYWVRGSDSHSDFSSDTDSESS